MPDKYALLQLRRTDETAWERFMSLAYVREHGREPNPEHYDLVYTGELTVDRETGKRYLKIRREVKNNDC